MQECQPTQWTRLRSRSILQILCQTLHRRGNFTIPHRGNEEESATEETGPHQHLLRAIHQTETRSRQDYLRARKSQQLCDAGGLYARQKALCPCRCAEVGTPEVP